MVQEMTKTGADGQGTREVERTMRAFLREKAVTCFTHNPQRMDYARFRKLGYFIGSGAVASAGKQSATLRLKRAGARWTERGTLLTAKARAAGLSGGWDLLASKRAALSLTA